MSLSVHDCADLLLRGARRDGNYLVYSRGHSVKVFCNFNISSGGWTVSTLVYILDPYNKVNTKTC